MSISCNQHSNRRRQWHPTPVLLPGKSHGRRSLVGCSPWGREESDTTERLHFHFPLSCLGEGNGNPLQCSCLENPRDGGAWWAAVYGVAQSRTRLEATQQPQQHTFFLKFVSIMVYHRVLNIVPCAMQQDLVAYPFHVQQLNSLHLPIPNSHCIPPLLPWQPHICSPCLWLFLFHR